MAKSWAENAWVVDPARSLPPAEVIFGRTEAMQEIGEKVGKLADAEVPVFIRGESGTGKEVLTKFMHLHSVWKSGPFVKVHCPAIPESLLESELFGYEEGAFTGARVAKPGRVEVANGGTLLLDEIAELNAGAQAKLLQVLQDGQVFRIGAQEGKRIRTRIVCATHRPVEQDIRRGRFRPDLFYRISVVTLRLPPLRERREDIPALIEYFLQRYARETGRPAPALTSYSLRLLQENDWPGNIRELENLVNRYLILGSEEVISDELLGAQAEGAETDGTAGVPVSLRRIARNAARGAERRAILQVLNAHQGNRKKTARVLNISYRSLLYKIKDAGIPRKGSPARRPEALAASPLGEPEGLNHEPPPS
jgi:two-component system, NtrC family, response regulator AtoC